MSISRRLFNLARAQVKGAIDDLSHPLESLKERRKVRAEVDEMLEQMRQANARTPEEPAEPEPRREAEPPPRRSGRTTEVNVNRWYANLELPIGASADEVRAAYRRLMRHYHPDRHFSDPEAARVATELSTRLREAYEGLLAYLERTRA